MSDTELFEIRRRLAAAIDSDWETDGERIRKGFDGDVEKLLAHIDTIQSETRSAALEEALDLCRQVRDDEVPPSWTKEFEQGHRAGAECCVTMIFNHASRILSLKKGEGNVRNG